MHTGVFIRVLVASLALAGLQVQAQTELSGSAHVSYEYDDNVSVDELEASSGQGDQANGYGIRLELKHAFSKAFKTSFSASHTGTRYNDFSNLDRDTNALSANAAYSHNKISAGINYFYINARIDGDDFLTYQRISPSVSMFSGKQWYWRLAYVAGQKDFESRRGRSADIDGYELETYFFYKGLKSYFNVGVATRTEDSLAANYDYESVLAKARWVNRFSLRQLDSKLEISLKYEDRDYASKSWGISEPRADKRFRSRIRLTMDVWEASKLQLFVSYNDYNSNLPTADYNQTVTGMKLIYEF